MFPSTKLLKLGNARKHSETKQKLLKLGNQTNITDFKTEEKHHQTWDFCVHVNKAIAAWENHMTERGTRIVFAIQQNYTHFFIRNLRLPLFQKYELSLLSQMNAAI